MIKKEEQVYTFDRTFTSREDLAEAFFNIKRIFGLSDEINLKNLSEDEIKEKFSVIRGSISVVYAKVDEAARDVFDKDITNLPEETTGEAIMTAINEIMDNADVDEDDKLPSDLEDRFENISILATRLEKAISHFDEDISSYKQGLL